MFNRSIAVLIAAVLGLAPSLIAHAQNVDACTSLTGSQYHDCLQRLLQKADRRLNEDYQLLEAKLAPRQKQQLTQAESAWIDFRDKTCVFEKARLTASAIAYTNDGNRACLLRETQFRYQTIDGILEDVSSP